MGQTGAPLTTCRNGALIPLNLSALPSEKWWGRLARLPLKAIPSSWAAPVLQGPLRGKKWIVGSHTHGCWLGCYELPQTRLFQKKLKRGDTVYDVGAHAGFYTLMASVLVGPGGAVIAIEPLPANLAYLRRHLELNRADNVRVVAAAAGETSGRARFDEGRGRAYGFLKPGGPLSLEVVSLDDLVFQRSYPVPTHMKIDVEGGEISVLKGARRLLEDHRPTLFLSTHTLELKAACMDLLTNLGYELQPIGKSDLSTAMELLASAA